MMRSITFIVGGVSEYAVQVSDPGTRFEAAIDIAGQKWLCVVRCVNGAWQGMRKRGSKPGLPAATFVRELSIEEQRARRVEQRRR